jgi:hypothetical protein
MPIIPCPIKLVVLDHKTFLWTMASLLPSLSSDEEDNLLDDPEDDEGVEVNKDFEFGGILVS